jgi:hypothetical protein
VQRVTRPRGGINEWLHWLPVSFHKKLEYLIRKIIFLTSRSNKLTPLPSQNGAALGLASVLEADLNEIVTMARQTYDKYFFFFFSLVVGILYS